ncbi:trichoplein keratin filament-binding protein [Drosophila guanche]|uniref:Blast:Trichoplein keratin filament-binding protein n=1 Tax=Drosophila guanche TaxID=7266 RepID=A0A3B0K2B6_DROGU|nr:trichoplein keratin filament-binding protein [Drosophila guanche]XP_034138500.1 trichoplein keratin filament-binding protein [Drosophila guanche]XP_034138501.1 trichoplein keratin filament-binding protein [Drosophila guanche]SPP88407.1 blast:Trichoplein keratin filament-binding protein [Drosophila guanche]
MSGRLNQQHAAYAQRREQENTRVQATQAVNRYYDHWGKVTTRFENWTNKEYYEKADKKLQSRKDQKQKEIELTDRKGRLRQLLDTENEAYDIEMGRKRRPKEYSADTQLLGRVNQSLKEQEQLKRKLEMEAKLYGRWRHGVDDEKFLYQSKSDNEVLAKLNWLDKQIEQQKEREEQEALNAERKLQLQQEISRTEQAQKERQLIQEQQIKEIRALQESHMAELRHRQAEAEKLKEEEQHFRLFIGELEKEKQLLEESTALVLQRPDTGQAFNLNKIKVFIRSRSEASRRQISLCINLLERVAKYVVRTEDLNPLLQKYKEQLEAEQLACTQIEAMYESEAKYNLQRCEENWREQHLQRYQELSKLIDAEKECLSGLLQENVVQQQALLELRSTHLAGIEQATKQLEQLNSGDQASPRFGPISVSSSEVLPAAAPAVEDDASVNVPKVSNSFSNLNLDVWQDLPPVRGGIDSPRLHKTRSLNVVTSQTAMPPKFARKRVAWY